MGQFILRSQAAKRTDLREFAVRAHLAVGRPGAPPSGSVPSESTIRRITVGTVAAPPPSGFGRKPASSCSFAIASVRARTSVWSIGTFVRHRGSSQAHETSRLSRLGAG
jgi:hypothetical protein